MATRYTTNKDAKVYNLKGTDIGGLKIGTVLTVFAFNIPIPDRGECYQITAPTAGFVKEADVKVQTVTDPPPDSEPPPLNDYIEHVVTDANGAVTRKKYIPEP